ncbi:MAG: hypothetical protein J6W07_03275, partial [Bacteroidales bacterium]|nr:hypothetical protein [Bacteroidales bacterium]
MFRRFLLIVLLSAACVCANAQVAVGYSAADEGIWRYLEEVDYSGDAGYTVSYVKDYKNKGMVSQACKVHIFDGVAPNMRDLGGW